MPAESKKEPMIDQGNRPTPINFDTPLSELKVQDLMMLLGAQTAENAKLTPQPELLKPELSKEFSKPEKEHFKELIKGDLLKELHKVEKEIHKPEKELFKPEKELNKPEKEFFKPELSKPEKEIDPRVIDQIAERIEQRLKERGAIK
jgi:hypothetical protein